jgi:hypothetical protein
MTTVYNWNFIKYNSTASKGPAEWIDECNQHNFFSKEDVKENILKFMELYKTDDIEYFEIKEYGGVFFSSLNRKMGRFSFTRQSSEERIHKNRIKSY